MVRFGAILCQVLALPISAEIGFQAGLLREWPASTRLLQAPAAPPTAPPAVPPATPAPAAVPAPVPPSPPGVNPSADAANHGVYADAHDPACSVPPAPQQITACTGGNTIALNRGMCVNDNCWDVCNGEHTPATYVGASLPTAEATSVVAEIELIRAGLSPNVSCPSAVIAEADRVTCGDLDRAGELCNPLADDGSVRKDRENLGMCILPNMGSDVTCRDMCAGEGWHGWEGDGWQVGLTDEDRQQIRDVQDGWFRCGFPWYAVWYTLLAILLIACIFGALYLIWFMRRRGSKSKRAIREREPEPAFREPEPMSYQREAPPPEAPPPPQPPPPQEMPATASARLSAPVLVPQQLQVIQTMAPQMTTMQLLQSPTRGSVSQAGGGTFYNSAMTTRMPHAYQSVPSRPF